MTAMDGIADRSKLTSAVGSDTVQEPMLTVNLLPIASREALKEGREVLV
jgi:hypothetical protein